jgi:hypothetical protein
MINSRMRWTRHVAHMRRRGMHTGFWWEEITGRPGRSWEDNIKMDLTQIGWGGMDWIRLAQDKDQWRVLVNTAINFLCHKMSGNC